MTPEQLFSEYARTIWGLPLAPGPVAPRAVSDVMVGGPLDGKHCSLALEKHHTIFAENPPTLPTYLPFSDPEPVFPRVITYSRHTVIYHPAMAPVDHWIADDLDRGAALWKLTHRSTGTDQLFSIQRGTPRHD